jgi:hypothetical protein
VVVQIHSIKLHIMYKKGLTYYWNIYMQGLRQASQNFGPQTGSGQLYTFIQPVNMITKLCCCFGFWCHMVTKVLKCCIPFCVNCIHFENCANSPLFIVFLPPIQVKCTEVTRVYGHSEGKLYLFITYFELAVS